MKLHSLPQWALPLAILGLAGTSVPASAETVHAKLEGFKEVPSVSTGASGGFRAKIDRGNGSIEFELNYTGLEGDVTQAHIHFGQRNVAGGISVWLCSNLASPPTPAGFSRPCPQSGTVTGTITASDVVGPAGQGIAAGELEELIAAIREGVAYVNVHTTMVPSGEIRGNFR